MLTGVSHGNRSIIPCLKKIRVGSRHRVRYGKLLRSSLHSSPQVIFSGIQPTGIPHLGNYLGALKQWVRLQNEASPNTQLIFSIVDLHAITVNQDAQQLRRWKRETLAALLSIGLDPKRSIIFYQSSVPAHAELMWILSCTASIGYLSRMTQWKSKLALADEASLLDTTTRSKLKLGLFSYPVLQAADILLYGTTHVPVGEDQIQHVEFTRECANNFNTLHGEVLLEPVALLSPTKRVMSLRNPSVKMSKSDEDHRSRILITDTPDDIRKKVQRAMTDSFPGVSFDVLERPGIANLLSIMAALDQRGTSIEELVQECSTLGMVEFKNRVTITIQDALAKMREKYDHLMKVDDGRDLEDVEVEGARRAREKADIVMEKVRHAVGFK